MTTAAPMMRVGGLAALFFGSTWQRSVKATQASRCTVPVQMWPIDCSYETASPSGWVGPTSSNARLNPRCALCETSQRDARNAAQRSMLRPGQQPRRRLGPVGRVGRVASMVHATAFGTAPRALPPVSASVSSGPAAADGAGCWKAEVRASFGNGMVLHEHAPTDAGPFCFPKLSLIDPTAGMAVVSPVPAQMWRG